MNGFSVWVPWFFILTIGAVIFLWWYYRMICIVEAFLKTAMDLLGGQRIQEAHRSLFYKKEEIKGVYKGRDVVIGAAFSGFKGEFLLLPVIRLMLKGALGYNLNRLPHYAAIDKNTVSYKVKPNVFWGVFDKNYIQLFSKNYLIIALDRLLATAEDLERGRTSKEFLR